MNNFVRYCNCLILMFSLSGVLSLAHAAIGDITTALGNGVAVRTMDYNSKRPF
jgi:hypothetical protein